MKRNNSLTGQVNLPGILFAFLFCLISTSIFAQIFKEMSTELGITTHLAGGVRIVNLDTTGRQWWFPGIYGLGAVNPIFELKPGEGQFQNISNQFWFILETRDYGSFFEFYDMNGDGRLDLCSSIDNFTKLGVVFLADENCNYSFDNILQTTTPATNKTGYPTFISYNDVNFDGYLDMQRDDSIFIYYNYAYVATHVREFFHNSKYEEYAKLANAGFWTDLNQDGKMDYIAGYKGSPKPNSDFFLSDMPNKKYNPVTYYDIPFPSNIDGSTIFLDFNSDGEMDYFDSRMGRHYNFYKRTGKLSWKNVTKQVSFEGEIDSLSASNTTAYFHDLNNAGWLDMITSPSEKNGKFNILICKPQSRNRWVYQNIAPDSLDYVPYEVGQTTFPDVDSDGDIDMVTGTDMFAMEYDQNRVLVNQLNLKSGKANWIKIWLLGTQTKGTPIGANVVLVNNDTTDLTWWKQVKIQNRSIGSGYDMHFGTGRISIIDSIYVRWPSGIHDTLVNVEVNKNLIITEGMTRTGIHDGTFNPGKLTLLPAYPNPFNPTTTLSWSTEKSGFVKLEVFNVLGQRVSVLISGFHPAGTYSTEFNASALTTGLYFCVLSDVNNKQTQKVMLIK